MYLITGATAFPRITLGSLISIRDLGQWAKSRGNREEVQ